METVQPIKDKALVQRLYESLKRYSDRDALLFLTGINTGFRISDILRIKVKNVMAAGEITQYLFIKESKTRKAANRIINPSFAKELKEYIEMFFLEPDDYLFFRQIDPTNHITRQYAWARLKKGAYKVGINNFGTHTMRKTFGYYAYQQTKNIALVMRLLNHKSPHVTLRYIGVDQQEQDEFLLQSWQIWEEGD